ncbi:MAG: hypothetical protein COB54_03330 [Alphaproteobacteria bacterium]|nr:MAG: hypothetical protein COB54_03330 [Alphaproteobacteria bacterium]
MTSTSVVVSIRIRSLSRSSLEGGRPHPVLQGDRDLNHKAAEPGNVTYYYSQTHLKSRGPLDIGGQSYPVAGLSWLDDEWGTSALGPDQQGWDLYARQLSDGSEMMFYNLR